MIGGKTTRYEMKYGTGDNLKMIFDLNQNVISFAVNDSDPKECAVTPSETPYYLAVCVSSKDSEVELSFHSCR